MEKPIKVLGEDIDPENFPALYRWAKANLRGLENVVKKTAEANRQTISATLVIMENEYQNDNS